MEQYIPYLAVILVVGVAIALFRLARRQQEALKKALMHSGFHLVPETDTAWKHDIASAKFEPDADIKMTDVFRYTGSDYDLYRFHSVQKQNHTGVQYAMVFRNVSLEPFSVLPNLHLPGFLDGLVKGLLAQVVTKAGFEEVDMGGCPEFRKKYRLYSANGHKVRQAVPKESWEALAALTDRLLLQGAGSTLKFQELSTTSNRANQPEEQLRNIVRQADLIRDAFRPALRQGAIF
jgi:hypothetical protein